LPTLSTYFAAGDEVAFRRTLERALAMVTILIIPAVLGLAAVGEPAIDLLFRHGETTAADARLIVVALLGYLPGTLFAAYDQILINAFYARRNTWWPVLVGIGATGVYFAVALPLGRAYGMIGLVLANSAQFVAHALIMAWLTRRVLGSDGWSGLRRVIVRSLGASLAMALAVFAVWLGLDRVLPAGDSAIVATLVEMIEVGLPALVGAGVVALLMQRFGIDEATELRRMLLGRLLPRLAR
jgi:putative peptidoglycan lipid II flippase